ncbi:MAG TPA: hypothetical protein VFA58_03950 [Chthoniobacterales bacterium]|nr:hypothetical protein [Chthoniobacterales bacterium]
MTQPFTGANQGRVRLVYKITIYVVAWLLALAATAPGLWPLAWMFPLGLVAVFDRQLANNGGWGIFIGCYVIYLVHGFLYFRSTTTMRTQILYGVLILFLIANVAGCRGMINSH